MFKQNHKIFKNDSKKVEKFSKNLNKLNKKFQINKNVDYASNGINPKRKNRKQQQQRKNLNRAQRQKFNDHRLRSSDWVGGAFPALFNIAPRAIVHSNATCGQNGREEYCKLNDAYPQKSWLTQCGVCNDQSSDLNRHHPIHNILNNTNSRDNWWQSPTLRQGRQYEYITITMDLRQIYHIFFIMLKAAISPRPASWILEKSLDNVTYEPWQYFGLSDIDCKRRYNIPSQTGKYMFSNDKEIICTTQFSKALPLENGEIHVSLVKNRPGANEQSPELMEFIKARYIRIRLQGLHSTANIDNSIDWQLDSESLEKRSFYSFKQIRISGRLDCHGHANRTVEIISDESDEDTFLQCACLHNTCGKDCSECCPAFRNKLFKDGTFRNNNECDKCNCNGYTDFCLYSEIFKSGICKHCTNHTAGNNCEECEKGYYRAKPSESCKSCKCNSLGSAGACNVNNGSCICKKGFEGEKCELCSQGYYGESCRQCDCDKRGAEPGGECGETCNCKKFVEGQSCNQCKIGYFGLQEDNPAGCTECFCSGVGISCKSTEINQTSYESMQLWQITDLSKKVFGHPSFDSETGFLVYGMYDIPEFDSAFWSAPEAYLGNKLTSYGGKLVAHLSTIVIRGDTSGKPTSGPNIILIGKNGMKIFNGDVEYHSQRASMSIDLKEHGWYHIPKSFNDFKTSILKEIDYRGDAVTRNHFISILIDLDAILIRASYHTDQVESILEKAIMYNGWKKENVSSDESFIENCICQPGYRGLSCEECDFSFIRVIENNTSFELTAKCVACPCNGHSEFCNLETGKCSECQHNTYGDRCERCKVGYYGNPLQGTLNDCKQCACPLLEDINNFSPNCQLKNMNFSHNLDYSIQESKYICTQCPKGYGGDHCEVCDEGYFGNPKILGSSCEPCSCEGSPCNIVTGDCIECQRNTEGLRCERCKLGFWGDPSSGCEPCNCYDQGSSTDVCDTETGQCLCKPHFTEKKCSKCDMGFADIDLKCPPCKCNFNGSMDGVCDPFSGQCTCKNGAAGLKCSECDNEYFGLDENGCKECLCNPIGSITRICDRRSGQCLCHPNVAGRQCQKCQGGFFNLTIGYGCRDCQCDHIGALSDDCDQWSGQCHCKNGVGNRRCDQCMDGFYGFSNEGCKLCEACQSVGHICDLLTGRCVCPPNSKGPDCRQCLSGTWGWHQKIGCSKCDCDTGGSIGHYCDPVTGQCICREGYTGTRCDVCKVGYFGYPDCRRCNCNTDGSFIRSDGLIECDSNGQCPCKELVIGLKCDTCVHSSFGLSRYNPEGCTKCFCFGRSQECLQSEMSWGHVRMSAARNLTVHYIHPSSIPIKEYDYIVVVQMEGTNINKQDAEIASMNGLNLIPSSIGNVTIGAYTAFHYPLYFQLPPQFHGDKTSSYGGYLRYQIITEGPTTPLDRHILYTFPLVQIHAHNKLVLDYYDMELKESVLNESYVLALHESYWKLHYNKQDVAREVLMTALQNIKHVFVRATTWSDFSNVVIHDLQMDSAIFLSGSNNVIAHGVEQCACPSQYDGLSCQNPGKGYYRFINNTEIVETVTVYWEDLIGRSVQCNCNNRSQSCDPENGFCLNCYGFTGGPNCEECAEGFFGNPNFGKCEACPCPETNRNFARGCTVWNNEVSCICKPGYKGHLCEKCRDGYFGNPDVNDGSCESCNCNIDGIVSNECHEKTGQCNCKPDVIGRQCNVCVADRHVLENRKCKLCDNCSLILMDYVDFVSNQLRRGVAHMDLTGIPAPYLKLDQYNAIIYQSTDRLEDFLNSKAVLKKFDENLLDKILAYSENTKIQFRKLNSTAFKKSASAGILYSDANKSYLDIARIKDSISKEIFELNNYGNNNDQISFPVALDQARYYLSQINYHDDVLTSMRESWNCSFENLYFYGNASDTVFDQKVTLEMLWRQLNITNHQTSDMDLITSNTFDILNEVDDIREHIVNSELYLNEDYVNIKETEVELKQLLNQQYAPGVEVYLDMLDNNVAQIGTNIQSIQNLKIFFNESDQDNHNLRRDLRKHWIPKAWRHSNRLMQRANEYSKMFQPTKNGARIAMLASSAHKNISEAIDDARESSIESKERVVSAQDKLYPSNTESVIERAQKSMEKSEFLQQDALAEMKKINSLRNNHKVHEDKVDSIKSIIWQAGIKNNNISASLAILNNDRSMKMIRDSIHLATKISDEMRTESRKAVDIKLDIYKLRQKFATLEPDWDIKLGLAKENISQTLSNIRTVNVSLNVAETRHQKAYHKFELWNNTVSKQLADLKDKIAKARHAAEAIKISLESLEPKCIRSYMPNAIGLSAANSIKIALALKNQNGDSPLVFLEGRNRKFISLELYRRKIRFVWLLGGQPVVLIHPLEIQTQDPKYDDAWYHIEANRTLNIGSLLVRRMTNNNVLAEATVVSASSALEFTEFSRTSFERTYVGGIPHNLKPKELLTSDGLNVIVNQIEIDNEPLGIWNFLHSEGNCKGAMVGAQPASSMTNARFFNGQGYSQVKKNRQRPYRKNIFDLQMTFKTMDENALLFLAIDDKNNRLISVSLKNGSIRFYVHYDQQFSLEILTTNKYNYGKWVTIEAAREFSSKRGTENGRLKINSENSILGSVNGSIKFNLLPDFAKGVFYLGGVAPGFEKTQLVTKIIYQSFLGCMKDIAINSETYDPLETSSYYGVEEICRDSITMAGFFDKGFIELPSQSLRKRGNVGFVFRTLQSNCLLLLSAYPPHLPDSKEVRGNYSVSLLNGRIHLWMNTGKSSAHLELNNSLNDGEYHLINIIKIGRKIELIIDDEYRTSSSFAVTPSVFNTPKDKGGLYIGGAPEFVLFRTLAPTFIGFQGTIKDLIINNRTISFSDALNVHNVQIGREGPSMGILNGDTFLMKTESVKKTMNGLPESCNKGPGYTYEINAHKYGDNQISFSEIVAPNRHFWQKNFLISLDLRTFYPNGILLVSTGSKEKPKHYVSLILKDGQLTFIVRSRRREELKLTAKLNDGEWHHIIIHSHDRKITMSVEIGGTDQKTSVQMKLPRKIGASNILYTGGLPENSINLPSEILIRLEGFKGCIRNLQINSKIQNLADGNKFVNVGRCFPKIEKGSHFPGDAYAIYKKNFHVGKYLELEMDIRTSEKNGILISVSEQEGFPALSLEIYQGSVVFSCDLGDGNPFRVESVLPSKFFICDNKWHNISALYDFEQIVLRVDNFSPTISFAQHRVAGKVQTKSQLYIGGLPEIAPSGTLLSRDNFKGCIRNVSIRNERKDWIDMDDLHNVMLSECLAT